MKTLVSVIAYNEEPNIRKTLEDLRANNCGFDIVVIDNGSHDATSAICRKARSSATAALSPWFVR